MDSPTARLEPARTMPEPSCSLMRFHQHPLRVPRLALFLALLVLGVSLFTNSQPIAAQSINDQHPARIVAPPPPKIDINRASIPQLMRVHGITQSYATRIVAGRPYANKGQLNTQGILPPEVYAATKDRLIAHHLK